MTHPNDDLPTDIPEMWFCKTEADAGVGDNAGEHEEVDISGVKGLMERVGGLENVFNTPWTMICENRRKHREASRQELKFKENEQMVEREGGLGGMSRERVGKKRKSRNPEVITHLSKSNPTTYGTGGVKKAKFTIWSDEADIKFKGGKEAVMMVDGGFMGIKDNTLGFTEGPNPFPFHSYLSRDISDDLDISSPSTLREAGSEIKDITMGYTGVQDPSPVHSQPSRVSEAQDPDPFPFLSYLTRISDEQATHTPSPSTLYPFRTYLARPTFSLLDDQADIPDSPPALCFDPSLPPSPIQDPEGLKFTLPDNLSQRVFEGISELIYYTPTILRSSLMLQSIIS